MEHYVCVGLDFHTSSPEDARPTTFKSEIQSILIEKRFSRLHPESKPVGRLVSSSMKSVLLCQLRLARDGTVLSHVVAVQRSSMKPVIVHLDSIDHKKNVLPRITSPRSALSCRFSLWFLPRNDRRVSPCSTPQQREASHCVLLY